MSLIEATQPALVSPLAGPDEAADDDDGSDAEPAQQDAHLALASLD